jgi:hypothetical protein
MSNALKKRIVVLDVDETLGYFVELGIFCDALTQNAWNNDAMAQYTHFNHLMDAFPEFLRPNILDILRYLKVKKDKNECCGVMVYTNNSGPRAWVEHIIKYMETKLGAPLFDQIVAAFKINGKIIEMGRTTHDKTYDDFMRCTKLPSNVEVCFLDDQMHAHMEHGQVYYINLKPYVHQLSVQTLMDRFMQSSVLRSTTPVGRDELRHRIETFMQRFSATHVPKDPMEQEIDRIISKKIMEHLNEFFMGSRPSPSIKIKSSLMHAAHAPHATNATNTLKIKMKMKNHKMTMKKKS